MLAGNKNTNFTPLVQVLFTDYLPYLSKPSTTTLFLFNKPTAGLAFSLGCGIWDVFSEKNVQLSCSPASNVGMVIVLSFEACVFLPLLDVKQRLVHIWSQPGSLPVEEEPGVSCYVFR